jgi:hypothetical protein
MKRLHAAPTVYLIQKEPPEGPVKIGYTRRSAKQRLAHGQTFSPEPLSILAESPASQALERQLHRYFEPLRIHGEWFRYEGRLKDLVYFLSEGFTVEEWFDHESVEFVAALENARKQLYSCHPSLGYFDEDGQLRGACFVALQSDARGRKNLRPASYDGSSMPWRGWVAEKPFVAFNAAEVWASYGYDLR